MENDCRISTKHFAESVKKAVKYAYKSILTPVEGTMVTLIKDWAESVYEQRHPGRKITRSYLPILCRQPANP